MQPTPAITFRTIGGILDFYFFLGPTPKDVIEQYTDVVGRPHLPPYWGLGFHLCRFGYKTLNETRTVMQRTIDAGIPLVNIFIGSIVTALNHLAIKIFFEN